MATKYAYPMSVLFVTVAMCAIHMATCVVGRDFSLTRMEDVFICAATGLFGGILGGLVGLHSYRRLARMVSGSVVGVVIGVTAGFMIFTDDQSVMRVTVTQILGSVGLVLFAVYFKMAGSDPLWGPPAESTATDEL